MGWLAIMGVDLSAIAATVQDPKGDRRDIGEISPANDGTMRATRQSRKHDLSLLSIPLSSSDAYAWESLVVGEGHCWSFDTSFYSSKGYGPTVNTGCTIDSSIPPMFGAGYAIVPATTGVLTYSSAFLNSSSVLGAWTFLVWKYESGNWHHYVLRSDGAKWKDGVRNDGLSTTWFQTNLNGFRLINTTGSEMDFDDAVALPFKALDTWPALIYAYQLANIVPFSSLPYLTCSGDLVPEAATRTMIGKCAVAKVLRGNPTGVAGGASKAVQQLQVDLQER